MEPAVRDDTIDQGHGSGGDGHAIVTVAMGKGWSDPVIILERDGHARGGGNGGGRP